MAVKIKLKRMGKIREPHYRIVVADARTKRDGRAIEEIGKYYPKAEPSFIEVDSDRAQHWLSVGALPTDPVRKLLEITGDWQRFKGLPGAEGTLRTAAPRSDKKEIFAAALAETLTDHATTPKGKGRAAGSKAGDAKAGDAKAGDAKAGDGKSGDAKAGEPKGDKPRAERAKTDKAPADKAPADKAPAAKVPAAKAAADKADEADKPEKADKPAKAAGPDAAKAKPAKDEPAKDEAAAPAAEAAATADVAAQPAEAAADADAAAKTESDSGD